MCMCPLAYTACYNLSKGWVEVRMHPPHEYTAKSNPEAR